MKHSLFQKPTRDTDNEIINSNHCRKSVLTDCLP
jgi:hypothetical protein